MIKKILLSALFFRLILSFGPYHPDLGNHLDWGIKFWQLGPKNFYENLFWQVSWANQPPGTIYLFAFIRKIYEGIFAIFWWLNLKIPLFPSFIIPILEKRLYVCLIKLPAILADLGIAFLIYRFVEELKGQKAAKLAAAIFLFNPASWYISAVWGQTDSIINFLVLWSVYLFWRKKSLPSVFVYFLSLYFKGSLIIFLPVILILLLKAKDLWWKKLLAIGGSLIFLSYLSFPFVKWMTPIPWIYHLYQDRIFGHQGNMLTANAFNFWALIFGIDFTKNDFGLFLGLTFRKWGQWLFVLSSLPVCFYLLKKKLNITLVFWSFAIISFSSFLFLTNMHERYLYPIFPYITILMFIVSKFNLFYLLISFNFFLNLYHLWYIPDILNFRLIYTPITIRFFSLFNLFLIFWIYLAFFRFLRLKKI